MAQIFHASTKVISKASIVIAVLVFGILTLVSYELFASAYFTELNVARVQPIQFSHEHHVRGLGMDCRYCHAGVENASYADIPPTHTCMTCHSQIWTTAPMLEPVRTSYRNNIPLHWLKVHDLPDFVYFNHGIHVTKGIGCSTCHGRVDLMQQTNRVNTLYMSWCLDCHRAPEKYIRPKTEIFSMLWTPPEDQLESGRTLVQSNHINVHQLTNCSICHR